MADEQQKPSQAVGWEVGTRGAECFVRFMTPGVPALEIPMPAQAAFEMGEKLARAAHQARYGQPWKSDESYLQDQIKRRASENMRMMLTRRLAVMLNSLREDKGWSNGKLAQELVDTVLTKVL